MILLLLSLTAFARDWESREGKFLNRTDFVVSCYGDDKDHPGKVCRRRAHRGETCRGDAVGMGDGDFVFKVPNNAAFFIDGEDTIVIQPQSLLSYLLFLAAKDLRPRRYGWMRWSHFVRIMGNREIVDCGKTNEEKSCLY
jgi:hypothetical protein